MDPISWLITAFSGIGANILDSVVAVLGNAVIAYVIERRFYTNKIILLWLTAFTAFTATVFSFISLVDPEDYDPTTIVTVFLTSLASWIVFFHVGAKNYGRFLSLINLGKWSPLAKNWVKSIDYIYLTLSTLSVLRIVVGSVASSYSMTSFNAVAAIVLGVAVALRLTRTSVEIFGWDKAPLSE